MKTFFYSFYQHQELLPIIYKSDKKYLYLRLSKTAYNRRFGNMEGRRIYSQLFVRYSASVPADGKLIGSRINNEL